jgi:hypothetical protein
MTIDPAMPQNGNAASAPRLVVEEPEGAEPAALARSAGGAQGGATSESQDSREPLLALARALTATLAATDTVFARSACAWFRAWDDFNRLTQMHDAAEAAAERPFTPQPAQYARAAALDGGPRQPAMPPSGQTVQQLMKAAIDANAASDAATARVAATPAATSMEAALKLAILLTDTRLIDDPRAAPIVGMVADLAAV